MSLDKTALRKEVFKRRKIAFDAGNSLPAVHRLLRLLEPHRGKGLGRHLTRHAAFWAADHGATHLAVLCTKANQGANALYSSLGMTVVGQYHYRIKEGPSS